ncbi:MAG: hypothetical protein ACI9WU_004107 [Myxococcota bacterium]|jgi:hypothetical protein
MRCDLHSNTAPLPGTVDRLWMAGHPGILRLPAHTLRGSDGDQSHDVLRLRAGLRGQAVRSGRLRQSVWRLSRNNDLRSVWPVPD